MTDHLAALYRIAVSHYPQKTVTQSSTPPWGEVEITSADDDAWFTAWEQATVAERVQFCRWLANVISRAWAGVSGNSPAPNTP